MGDNGNGNGHGIIGSDAIIADRRAKALDLRKRRFTYRQIAKLLNISHEQARRDILDALHELNSDAAESAEEVRAIELMKLDAIEQRIHERLDAMHTEAGPVDRERLAAEYAGIDRIIKISERRAKIVGIDAPMEVYVKIDDVAQSLRNYNDLLFGVIGRFVPPELQAELKIEMRNTVKASLRGMPAEPMPVASRQLPRPGEA